MSHSASEGQFDDADVTCTSQVGDGAADSDDDEWDLLYGGDDDMLADFEEETRDFTKKLNAARGSGGGLAPVHVSKKGASERITSTSDVSKAMQVGSKLCVTVI